MCKRGWGGRAVRGMKTCKGHGGKFSGLVSYETQAWKRHPFPLMVSDVSFKSAGLCALHWKTGLKFKMLS